MRAVGNEEGLRIKQREAFYCNVKLLLIFMVIYGHMIESMIDSVEPLAQVYRVIYSVHMPLFLFLSGFFLKSRISCLRQVKQMLLYYGACQSAVVLVGRMLGIQLSLGIPVWLLWYLLSLSCMAALGWLWYVAAERWEWLNHVVAKIVLLNLAVILACTAGEWSAVGRWLSLSRTICFLPYFLAGMFCPAGMNWKNIRVRIAGLIGLAVYLLLYFGPGRAVPTELFYQADSYSTLMLEQGVLLRLICMLLAAALGLTILTLVPDRRYVFSKLGTDTLGIYLLHGPMIKILEQMWIPMHVWIALSPFLAMYMIYFLYKLFQWQRPLYSLPTVKQGW